LEFACAALRADPEVCLAAIAGCGGALRLVSATLQCDADFIAQAIRTNPQAYWAARTVWGPQALGSLLAEADLLRATRSVRARDIHAVWR
jgi:hypothetical protein